jgi:hypothetical protein
MIGPPAVRQQPTCLAIRLQVDDQDAEKRTGLPAAAGLSAAAPLAREHEQQENCDG